MRFPHVLGTFFSSPKMIIFVFVFVPVIGEAERKPVGILMREIICVIQQHSPSFVPPLLLHPHLMRTLWGGALLIYIVRLQPVWLSGRIATLQLSAMETNSCVIIPKAQFQSRRLVYFFFCQKSSALCQYRSKSIACCCFDFLFNVILPETANTNQELRTASVTSQRANVENNIMFTGELLLSEVISLNITDVAPVWLQQPNNAIYFCIYFHTYTLSARISNTFVAWLKLW